VIDFFSFLPPEDRLNFNGCTPAVLRLADVQKVAECHQLGMMVRILQCFSIVAVSCTVVTKPITETSVKNAIKWHVRARACADFHKVAAKLRPHPTEPVPDVTLPIFRAFRLSTADDASHPTR